MGTLYIKGGTPTGSASLCKTCSYAQIMTGYRESEQLILCTDVNPNIALPFNIYDCTSYYDKNRPSYEQMQKLAINVVPDPLKKVGFKLKLVPSIASTEPDED